jgi:hypothetical protein
VKGGYTALSQAELAAGDRYYQLKKPALSGKAIIEAGNLVIINISETVAKPGKSYLVQWDGGKQEVGIRILYKFDKRQYWVDDAHREDVTWGEEEVRVLGQVVGYRKKTVF